MKKILFTFLVFAFCLGLQAQKITALTESTVIDNNALFLVRAGSTGDLLKRITLANILKDRTFTGTITLPSTTSIGSVSDTELGYLNNVTSAIQTQFTGKINRADSVNYVNGYMSRFDGVAGLALKVNISDSASMLTKYITTSEARGVIADSLNALRNAGVTGVLLADSVNYTKGYMSRFDGVTGLAAKVAFVPDSVQHTADFTLALTDLNKDMYCIKTGNKLTITIPTTASVNIPVGSTFNFYGEGASLLHFHAASGVSMHSDKDSVTTSRIHQVVGLKKRGNNYWILYGPLTD